MLRSTALLASPANDRNGSKADVDNFVAQRLHIDGMNLRNVICLIVIACCSAPAWAQLPASPPAQASGPPEVPEDCDRREGIDPFSLDECLNRTVARNEEGLARAFAAARSYVSERAAEAEGAMDDVRRNPIYLDWSQAAWRQYVEQDCRVRAGLTGGASIWISRRERDCYLDELNRRIAFLESVASGQFDAP